MLKSLRRKFVAITMIIVTLMLTIILGLIYFSTKSNIEATSIAMMQSIANRPLEAELPEAPSEDVRLPYFTLRLSTAGQILAVGGDYYDLSDRDFLYALIEKTQAQAGNTGVIEDYNLRYYRVSAPGSVTIVYSDISSEQAILHSLTITCGLIGAAAFAAFFALSILLAKWAVRPAEEAWKQQRRFLADASHELKTPLTVIMTNAELLGDPSYDEKSRSRFQAAILTMSRQMRGLVEQMLELARADCVEDPPDFAEVDFSEVVSDAVLPFEPVFFEKGLSLTTEIEEGLRLRGDAEKLKQLVDILLDNAGKYSRPQGRTTLSLSRRGRGNLFLRVANEGEPIPPEQLTHLFKRFYRGDPSRSRDGSYGLGLSIAASIVSRHGGRIWAESVQGVNAFCAEFPVRP